MLDEARRLRRELHTWPEIGLDLPRTREAVLQALEGLPLDITLHTTTSGIAAMLTGDKPGPTVMLRGDMDALPMPEDMRIEYSNSLGQSLPSLDSILGSSLLASSMSSIAVLNICCSDILI